MASNPNAKRYKLKPFFLQSIGILFILAGVYLIIGAVAGSEPGTSSLEPSPELARDQRVVLETAEETAEPSIGTGLATANIKVNAMTASSQLKAEITKQSIARTGQWIATDYVRGDIGVGEYTVQRGDTLWEISEAVYGQGQDWQRLLASNPGKIGFLPNGSQALIIPGQVLTIVL